MADADTNIDKISPSQARIEDRVNEYHDAASLGTYFGRHAVTCVAFTWGYYGGVIGGVRYTNGTLDLSGSPSATCYVETNRAGVTSFNTTAFTPGSVGRYIVPTTADAIDNTWQDLRETSPWARLYQSYADVGSPNNNTETDLQSNTTPASILATNGDFLHAVYGGIFQGAGTVTPRWQVYFGGTLIYNSGDITFGANCPWRVTVDVVRESSSVVRCISSLEAVAFLPPQYTRVTGLTLSNTNILKLTIKSNGSGQATNDVVKKMHYVNLEPAG